tara:strand:+ start:264 stop:407 length:144 start_codon:yes stop_codon:yes gene_type:complete
LNIVDHRDYDPSRQTKILEGKAYAKEDPPSDSEFQLILTVFDINMKI